MLVESVSMLVERASLLVCVGRKGLSASSCWLKVSVCWLKWPVCWLMLVRRVSLRFYVVFNEARERKARAFFWRGGGSKGKRPLLDGSHEREVPFFSFYLVYVVEHFFRPRLFTALNAHGTNASPSGLCPRTHNRETFSLVRL